MSACEECGGTGVRVCLDDDCGMELPCTECALAGRWGRQLTPDEIQERRAKWGLL